MPEQPRFGLTRDELNVAMEQLPGGGLHEEFSDGELWPTEGLSDKQIELLTDKLRKVERAKQRESRLGRHVIGSIED